jgi:hypothetical protein
LNISRTFANGLAISGLRSDQNSFAEGSVIIREKLLKFDDPDPELITLMIKREKGFSKDTDDWEFLVIDGKIKEIKIRETIGNCAECHSKAKQTDWVFREYLKKK